MFQSSKIFNNFSIIVNYMESIPASLVKSLNDLGLSNNEANVYAALVLYDNAEAKDLVEYLTISKPSGYSGKISIMLLRILKKKSRSRAGNSGKSSIKLLRISKKERIIF